MTDIPAYDEPGVLRTVEFDRVFSAAHRVWNDDGKCANIHGHNYRVVARVTADRLNPQNFVVPFAAVKDVIDHFDHATIIDENDPFVTVFNDIELKFPDSGPFNRLRLVPGVPSTEFMADLLAERIARAVIDEGYADYVQVGLDLRETDGIEASAWRDVARDDTP